MRHKASVSHDDAMVRRLRKDPDFAAQYLKAALEDADEPCVLLIALRPLDKHARSLPVSRLDLACEFK